MDKLFRVWKRELFYAPNFEEVEGTSKKLRGNIGLGLSVRLSVIFVLGQEPLEIGS